MPTRPPLSIEQLRQLESIVVGFVDKHEISCPEAVWQCDEVITNAYNLVKTLTDVVGYFQYEDDNDA